MQWGTWKVLHGAEAKDGPCLANATAKVTAGLHGNYIQQVVEIPFLSSKYLVVV